MIIQNQIRCKKCGDTPYSTSTHDYKSCKCGAVSVDGGISYLKRRGNPKDIEDISIIVSNDIVEILKLKLKWCKETNRNDFGIICAIFRVLRDAGYLKGNNMIELDELKDEPENLKKEN